jgi:hypothetical protein
MTWVTTYMAAFGGDTDKGMKLYGTSPFLDKLQASLPRSLSRRKTLGVEGVGTVGQRTGKLALFVLFTKVSLQYEESWPWAPMHTCGYPWVLDLYVPTDTNLYS